MKRKKFNGHHEASLRIRKKYLHLRQEASLSRMLNGNIGDGLDRVLTKLEKRFPGLDRAYASVRGF